VDISHKKTIHFTDQQAYRIILLINSRLDRISATQTFRLYWKKMILIQNEENMICRRTFNISDQ